MLKVLIAEDDLLMADMLEDVLVDNGYEVCGVARTVEEGVAIGQRCKPDLALLDVRLADGGLGTEIAARLGRPGPAVLYATGNGTQVQLTGADGDAVLGKPYRTEDLVRALRIVEQIASTGKTALAFPGGFRLLARAPERRAVAAAAAGRRSGGLNRILSQQAAFLSFIGFAHGEADHDRLVAAAVRSCAEIMAVPVCIVWRHRREKDDLVVDAAAGWPPGGSGMTIPCANAASPHVAAFTAGQPAVFTCLAEAADIAPPRCGDGNSAETLMAVPVACDGRPWGLIEIATQDPEGFDENDLDIMTAFAGVLAEGMSPAKRNSALRDRAEQVNGLIARRIEAASARERKEAAGLLALKEKLAVTQEMQHRVRNNLQVVYGMLGRQMRSASGPSEREGIGAIARAVITMARVYDHLVGTGLGEKIDFGAYLSSLCASFSEMEDPQAPKVTLACHVGEVMLDLDTVTALGLIVSELLSNCYLHAFPGRTGSIAVTLLPGVGGGDATLVFADDGIGFTEPVEDRRRGLGLVRRLIKQINGSAVLQAARGSIWTIRFPAPEPDHVNGPCDTAAPDGLGKVLQTAGQPPPTARAAFAVRP
jgi:two-component sensor histidine kinase/CheY-like chemotaxis protein